MSEEVKWLGAGLSSDLIFHLKVQPYPCLVTTCRQIPNVNAASLTTWYHVQSPPKNALSKVP